jgi:amino acid transporter
MDGLILHDDIVDVNLPSTSASPSWERRRLGLGAASALVVANLVGAGLFTTSGFALADLGDARWLLLAWVVGGAVALCGALSYGGIAQRIPVSGGEAT